MRAQARALLDELVPRGRFDVVRDLAAPVATVATCAQLGAPGVGRAAGHGAGEHGSPAATA